MKRIDTAARSTARIVHAPSCTSHVITPCAAMCLSGEIRNMRHSTAFRHRSAMHITTSADANGTANCSAPIFLIL